MEFVQIASQFIESLYTTGFVERLLSNKEISRWKELDAITSRQQLKAEINSFFKDEVGDIATRIEAAAIASHIKVVEIFKKRLCLDFKVLSKQLMLDSFQSFFSSEETLEADDVDLEEIFEAILDDDLLADDQDLKTSKYHLKQKHKTKLSRLEPSKRTSIYQTTPMHWAAIMGNKQLIQCFLDLKNDESLKWLADLDAPAEGDFYPLHCAIQYCLDNGDDFELLKLLCTEQAVFGRDYKNRTAIYIVLTKLENLKELLEYMLDFVPEAELSLEARALLLEFADAPLWERKYLLINVIEEFSGEEGCLELVEFLIDHGANVDAKRNDGTCALLAAISKNDLPLVQLLINCNADIDAKDSIWEEGVIVHALSMLDDPIPMVKLLLKCGADINADDKYNLDFYLNPFERILSYLDYAPGCSASAPFGISAKTIDIINEYASDYSEFTSEDDEPSESEAIVPPLEYACPQTPYLSTKHGENTQHLFYIPTPPTYYPSSPSLAKFMEVS